MRRATFAICALNAAFVIYAWMGIGGSDIAGNGLMQALAVLLSLVFAATTIPAFALAVAGWLPRAALALALASSLLCLLVYGL